MALHNLARMTSATTGTGTLTLGSAVPGFLSFADAGIANAEKLYYVIRDGVNSEVGLGTYTSSGTTLSRDTVYESTNAGAKISCSGGQEIFVTLLAETYANGLTKAPVMWHDQSIVTGGAALATTNDTSCYYAWYVSQGAGAILNSWNNGFVCQAGTYTFNALVVKDTSHGILTAQIDSSVTLGTVDLYAASTQRNQVVTIGSCVLTEGYHKFIGITVSKNASSSGYKLAITKMWFTPSAY
jgi:hypothetical protein